MSEYFNLLKDVLMENKLMESPGQIYNVNETGMPLDHRPPKVVTKKGQKKVRCRTSGNKSQITVISCVSATGQVVPPFVIFAHGLKRPLPLLLQEYHIAQVGPSHQDQLNHHLIVI